VPPSDVGARYGHGGQQQRLALVCTLVKETKVLLSATRAKISETIRLSIPVDRCRALAD